MILIDPPAVARWDRLWSHLASDTSYAEAHEFSLVAGPAGGSVARIRIPFRTMDG